MYKILLFPGFASRFQLQRINPLPSAIFVLYKFVREEEEEEEGESASDHQKTHVLTPDPLINIKQTHFPILLIFLVRGQF